MHTLIKATLLAAALGVPLAARPALAVDANIVQDLENNARYWQDRGRDDKAAEAWEKVLRADPENADALAALAGGNARAGHYDVARDYLNRLKRAHPGAPESEALQHRLDLGAKYDQLIGEARALARAGKPAEAVARYREAFGDSAPLLAEAYEYLQTLGGTEDGWQEAVDGLRKFAHRYPKDGRYELALGKLLTYRESSRSEGLRILQKAAGEAATRQEALAAWRQALMWEPLVPASEPLFAEYLQQVPDDEQITQRRGQIKKSDTRSTDVEEGYLALRHSNVKDAERHFRAAGSAPEALVGQALIALKQQDFEKAKVLLERVKVLAPEHPEMWEHSLKSATFWLLMKQAKAARAEKKDDVAEARLLEAVNVSSEERSNADLELANLYLSQKAYDKAEPRLRQVIAADPHQVDAMRDLVILLAHTGRGTEARTLNEGLAKVDATKAFNPGWLTAEELRERAADSKQTGKLDEAHADLLAARDADPTDEWVLHDLANLDMELGDLNEAATVVHKLVAEHPELVAGRVTEARLLARQGKNTAALEAITNLKASEMTPDLEVLKRKLEFQIEVDGIVAKALGGKRAIARQDLLIMERRGDGNPDLMAIMALAWADLGDFDHATLLMRDAIAKTDKPTAAMRLQLASIFLKADDDVNLEALLDQLNDDPSLNPAEREGLTNLRIAHAVRRADQLRTNGDLVLAFAQLKPILEEMPDQPKLLCALGRLFQAQDNYDDAHAVFLRVLRNDPGNYEARAGAIDTAVLVGNISEARRLVSEGLANAPQDPRMHLIAGRFAVRMDDDASAMNELEQAEALAESAAVHAAVRAINGKAGAVLPAYIPERGHGPLTADSNPTAFLNRASASFGGSRPNVEQRSASEAQGLQDEIEQEIDRLRARHRVEVGGHLETRVRQGQDGLGALTELRVPVEVSVPLAYTGRLTFGVTPVVLDAGSLDMSNASIAQTFGSSASSPGTAALPQSATGTELHLGYKYKTFGADLGTTPLGFAVKNITGGLEWRDQFGTFGIAAEVSRRTMTDSVLSYAGTKDPSTGITWGGVIKEGGRLDLALLTAQATYFIVGDYRYLTGLNVPDNQSLMGGAGLEWKLYDSGQNSVVTGANVVGLGYSRNLRYFTLGNAGYFSPQAFAHIGIPFRWQRSGKLQVDVTAEPGVNWFREDQQQYYPLDPTLQAERAAAVDANGTPVTAVYPGMTSVAFALNFKSKISYPISDSLKGAFELSYHTAADYQELFAALQLEFDFASKRSHGETLADQ